MRRPSDSYVSRALLGRRWRWLRASLFDSYRPELHYMRGPGPKWRAKHGIAEPAEAPTHATPAAA